MSYRMRVPALFALVVGLIIGTGNLQSWNAALFILNMGLISAIMSLGLNLQWGIAGLLNVGVMGFVALGGLATVIVSMDPVPAAWDAGGLRILFGLAIGALTISIAIFAYRKIQNTRIRFATLLATVAIGFTMYRYIIRPGVEAVEAINPATEGYLGGLGLPILLSWPVGGLLAAAAAWIIGKTALGLRSDYLAIATLGISEILIAILKNEDWLSRGVKNAIGIPRPVPYEINLQSDPYFVEQVTSLGIDPTVASTLFVKILYACLFSIVLVLLLWLSERALNSPWGRMMRAIRDNETAARAMGKDVTARHLQVFIIGSAICGIAGAMMTTLDSQLTPSSYQPLRFTFLIWVMVIVGGSGNNIGSILGGFLIWFLWVQVEPIGYWLVDLITATMSEDNPIRTHLLKSVAQMRLLIMGLFLLVMLRFNPKGMIPER
jgi:branched-chain amino acid transport system permease protein